MNIMSWKKTKNNDSSKAAHFDHTSMTLYFFHKYYISMYMFTSLPREWKIEIHSLYYMIYALIYFYYTKIMIQEMIRMK